MGEKHLYITVKEKNEFEAILRQYGLKEQSMRVRRAITPESPTKTEKKGNHRGRRLTSQ